jgi:hypothetical protein
MLAGGNDSIPVRIARAASCKLLGCQIPVFQNPVERVNLSALASTTLEYQTTARNGAVPVNA